MAGHVLFCGAFDDGPGYPRTAALRAGLAEAGLPVRECRVPGRGADKQRLLRQPWRWPLAAAVQWRQQRALHRALARELRAHRPRCIVVPYPGHHVVRGIRARSDVPVVLDLFLSAYDTVVEDRRLVLPGSLGARLLQRLDARACAAADLVLLDTAENAAYAAALTGVAAERFAWLPVSDPFAVAPAPLPRPGFGPLQVLFFGTGVPLHGLGTLLEAVADAPAVHLTLVGGTPQDRRHAAARLGPRLSLEPQWVDRARLQELLAQCQLVAGVFGGGGKAQRVVPWKVVHALAAGRPVLTADSPAVCRWLDGSGAVFLVPANDPAALGAALSALATAPQRVAAAAAAARPAYERHFSAARCGQRWGELLARAEAEHARRDG